MTKKFVVKAVLTQALELDVEASDEKSARKKADRTNLNEWVTVEDLSFEIESIDEEKANG